MPCIVRNPDSTVHIHVLSVPPADGKLAKARKQFFFGKKNQKLYLFGARASAFGDSADISFLLLFLEKEGLACLPDSTERCR